MASKDMVPAAGQPDIISKIRFEGHAPNAWYVKTAIVIPADVSVPIYGKIVCEVKVFSRTKRGHLFRGLFDLSALNEEQAAQKAGVTGGALSERLEATLPSGTSPDEAAKEAYKAFKDALKRYRMKIPTPQPKDASLAYILEALKALGQ